MDFKPVKYLIVKLLDDLKINNRSVDVLTEFPPGEQLPVVTMNSNGGTGHIESIVQHTYSPLPSNHPYYDPQATSALYNTGRRIIHVFEGKLMVHIWTECNEERDILTEQITDRLIQNSYKTFYSSYGNVRIGNLNGATDIDQFDSYPPLYHTTFNLDFNYEKIFPEEDVNPFLDYQKKNRI